MTREECLARLAATPESPRGERLAKYVAAHQSQRWPNRYWVSLWASFIQRSDDDGYIFTSPDVIRRRAASVRRLREERNALRARVKVLEDNILSLESTWIPPPYGEL